MQLARLALIAILPLTLSGCLAASAVGATVGVAGAAAKTTVKGAGAVAGAVIP